MKRLTALIMVLIISLIFCSCFENNNSEPALIRLHIRANSNSSADQSVKLRVRNAINEYLSVRLKDIDDYQKAVGIIKGSLKKLEDIADSCLTDFDYKSSADFRNEYFPVRAYEDLVLNSGYYDALIIGLGDAAGDNWWCIIYPPLCYMGASQKVEYKSIIKEWLSKWFGK